MRRYEKTAAAESRKVDKKPELQAYPHSSGYTRLIHFDYYSASSLAYYAFCSFAIAASIRAIVSSLPSTSMSSVAPPGVICLPETAVRIGHIT